MPSLLGDYYQSLPAHSDSEFNPACGVITRERNEALDAVFVYSCAKSQLGSGPEFSSERPQELHTTQRTALRCWEMAKLYRRRHCSLWKGLALDRPNLRGWRIPLYWVDHRRWVDSHSGTLLCNWKPSPGTLDVVILLYFISSPSISVDEVCFIQMSLGRLLFRRKLFTSPMTSVSAWAYTMTFVSFMFRLSTTRSQPHAATVSSTLASPIQHLKLDVIAGLLAGEILPKINYLSNHGMSRWT